MSKRVMIVGASALQVSMILKAKELGYEVGVVDYNPAAEGIKFADKFYEVSTIDKEGVCRATEEFGAVGITTVATDMPMRAIAYTCEKLALAGISEETALNATDKARMIKKFAENNVPHPWFFDIKDRNIKGIEDKLKYPCICKPTDNSGSRGVVIINSKEELSSAVAYASANGRSGEVIIEELLTGSEISVETFVVDGEVYMVQVTDKLTTGANHFVEMGHSQPSVFLPEKEKEIYEATKAAVLAVGIFNGPAHVEMMITDDGPKLIELGARLGGDYITTDLVPLSTGIDLLGETIKLACGEKVDIRHKYNKASAIRYIKTNIGMIKSIEGVDAANKTDGVQTVSIQKAVGEKTEEIRNSNDRIGYVISQADTVADAVDICERSIEKIEIVVE